MQAESKKDNKKSNAYSLAIIYLLSLVQAFFQTQISMGFDLFSQLIAKAAGAAIIPFIVSWIAARFGGKKAMWIAFIIISILLWMGAINQSNYRNG